jgi:hypothetical protein
MWISAINGMEEHQGGNRETVRGEEVQAGWLSHGVSYLEARYITVTRRRRHYMMHLLSSQTI